MVITVHVSITPLHLRDAKLVGTSPLTWEAVWIIQTSNKLQYPDLCAKYRESSGTGKPTTNPSLYNIWNECMCSKRRTPLWRRPYEYLPHTEFTICRITLYLLQKLFMIEIINLFCIMHIKLHGQMLPYIIQAFVTNKHFKNLKP